MSEGKQQDTSPEIKEELSQVATNPKQNMLIIGAIALVGLFLIYTLFIAGSGGDAPKKVAKLPSSSVIKPEQADLTEQSAALPQLPTPPKLDEPEAPKLPEAPKEPPKEIAKAPEPTPALPTLPAAPKTSSVPSLPSFGDNSPAPSLFGNHNQREEQKRKSSIMLVAGQAPPPTDRVANSDLVRRKPRDFLLGRGKVLNAVLETALNSDTGGEVRAIISQDVVSESGKNILIPRGARVFGTYNTGISGAYGRVNISWDRVDISSQYSLNLSAHGVDGLGRKGMQGRVDNKYKERIGNVLLMTALNVELARGLDKIVKPVDTTNTTSAGQTQATTIRTGVVTIQTGSGADAAKTASICSLLSANITDPASAAYPFIAQCNAVNGTDAEKLASAVGIANNAADSLLTAAVNSSNSSKAQQAAEEGFTQFGDVLKDIVGQYEFTPTITIDQGTPVKIYVTRDYEFPREAIIKTRLIP